jgi:hypothetical protein
MPHLEDVSIVAKSVRIINTKPCFSCACMLGPDELAECPTCGVNICALKGCPSLCICDLEEIKLLPSVTHARALGTLLTFPNALTV